MLQEVLRYTTRLGVISATVGAAALLLSATATAGPIMGSFDAAGPFGPGTDLEDPPGAIVPDNSAAFIENSAGDYLGMDGAQPDITVAVGTIDPLSPADLPLDNFLVVLGNGFDLSFTLLEMGAVDFLDADGQNGATFNGSGTVTGSRPGDADVDGTFSVLVTANQTDGEGTWSGSFVSDFQAVPEPATLLLFGGALAGLGLIGARTARRR